MNMNARTMGPGDADVSVESNDSADGSGRKQVMSIIASKRSPKRRGK